MNKPALQARRTGHERCAYCHDSAAGLVRCSKCQTLLHAECSMLSGRCPTIGCDGSANRPSRLVRDILTVVVVYTLGIAYLWGVGTLMLALLPGSTDAAFALTILFGALPPGVVADRCFHEPTALELLFERGCPCERCKRD